MERRSEQLGVGTLDLTERERGYLSKVLDSGRLSYGEFSRRFEREFAELHGCRHAVFVNSGTSALCIAVACLKEVGQWKPGDEILVPALTFVATANVVLEHGLKPVFVDCDPKTYNMDPKNIEKYITRRTRAIIPVHLFGLVSDMDPILKIAKKHHLRIIEDSCETAGVSYRGRMTGSLGDISCFSTYVAHLIVTGVGGLAVTKSDEYAAILRSIANHGRDNIYLSIDDDKDIDGARFREIIRRRFRFIRPGYSFRATQMEAALGLGQLERLPEILSARQRNARYLSERFRMFEQWLQLPWYDPSIQDHAFMMYPIVIRRSAPFSKMDLVEYLETWNVETRDMLPLINQPAYKHLNVRQEDYPVAQWVNENGFYIGCHQGFKTDELDYMISVMHGFFTKRGLL